MQALAVAEAGNLLMMAPRARDAGEWMTLSLAMTDRAEVVAQAAAARDGARLLATGGDLYTTCTECHDKYLNQ
jgi:cytochrome c5